MLRIWIPGIVTLLFMLGTYSPSGAIPICPSGTMADYIGFGGAGCQFNTLTFSNFSYSSSMLQHVSGFPFFGRVFPEPSPSEISVQPRSFSASAFQPAPALGSGGAGLQILAPSPDFWEFVGISFSVSGPGIVRDDLSGGLVTIADILPRASLFESATPGGSRPLLLNAGLDCGTSLPDGTIMLCREFFDSVSFTATPFQHIDISGFRVAGVKQTSLLQNPPRSSSGAPRWPGWGSQLAGGDGAASSLGAYRSDRR